MMEKDKITYYKGLVIGGVVAGVIGFMWSIEAEKRGRWSVEKDALLNGAAQYGVDQVTAKPVFKWNN